MAARAMWKAILCMGRVEVPVKLYSAVEDRTVHFRLLHRKDHAPVKQAMVNPDNDEVVAKEDIQRGYFSPEGELVMLEEEELDALQPAPSRAITVQHFLPPSVIDHRYYRRPYYLGPDGDEKTYAAFVKALDQSGKEGFATWVMRKQSYQGALRLHQGYPILIALRHAEEVVPVDSVEAPTGAELDAREKKMSRQLIDMLADDFEPEQYHDSYRQQVLELIQTKASDGKVSKLRPRKKRASKDLSEALEASLQQEAKRA